MRDLSPVMIASNEERKRQKFDGIKIANALKAYNVPALPSDKQPIDVLWYVDGQCVAADCKTVGDFISSYIDGRLHQQITAMQEMDCKFYFLLIEGDPWSEDHGVTVGGIHGWTWDGFDDAMLDVQLYGGVKIVRSPSKEQTARRIAACGDGLVRKKRPAGTPQCQSCRRMTSRLTHPSSTLTTTSGTR